MSDKMKKALEWFVQFHSGHVLPPELGRAMVLAREALEEAGCPHDWTGPIIGPSGYTHYCRTCMERRRGMGPRAAYSDLVSDGGMDPRK